MGNINNPVVKSLTEAITPIVSIGVGSAICSVCGKLKLSVEKLEPKDLPMLKKELVKHYERFWSNKIQQLSAALDQV
jgi:hypothetical protein